MRSPRRIVAIVTLVLHALVPFAAYAKARPVPGDDLCTVAKPLGERRSAPESPARHVPLSHCAMCPGGVGAAALPPSPPASIDLALAFTPASAPLPRQRAGTRLPRAQARAPPLAS
jgi:hypothetical protein